MNETSPTASSHPPTPASPTKGKLTFTPQVIPLSAIERDESQPRTTERSPEDAAALATSIAQSGILQPPIVRPGLLLGMFIIMMGAGRIAAARAAGLTEVLCLVATGPIDEAELRRMQFSENQVRTALSPIDQARLFKLLRTTRRWSQTRIAEFLNISQSHVSEYMDLLKLPAEIQDKIASGKMGIRQAKRAAERLKKTAPSEPSDSANEPAAEPPAPSDPLNGLTLQPHSWTDSGTRLTFLVGTRSKRPVTNDDLLRALKRRVKELEAASSETVRPA